jgi:hypothetical protein
LHAAELASEFKLAGANALIYASALRHRATLVPYASHFSSVPGVEYRAKERGKA